MPNQKKNLDPPIPYATDATQPNILSLKYNSDITHLYPNSIDSTYDLFGMIGIIGRGLITLNLAVVGLTEINVCRIMAI